MKFLDDLRNKPEHIRKRILWVTIVVLGLILGSIWIYSCYKNIVRLKSSNIIEDLNLPETPEFNIPE